MLSTRQYLRQLKKQKEEKTLLKLFELSGLSEIEYWLMYYAFVKGRMVENTCSKLGMSKTLYHTTMNIALVKVDYTIKKIEKIRTFD